MKISGWSTHTDHFATVRALQAVGLKERLVMRVMLRCGTHSDQRGFCCWDHVLTRKTTTSVVSSNKLETTDAFSQKQPFAVMRILTDLYSKVETMSV